MFEDETVRRMPIKSLPNQTRRYSQQLPHNQQHIDQALNAVNATTKKQTETIEKANIAIEKLQDKNGMRRTTSD